MNVKEEYARKIAKELKAQGINKIEYAEYGEGARGITVNDTRTEENLSDKDMNSIDVLIMTLSGLPNLLPEITDFSVPIPKTSTVLEGIEIIVTLEV